MANINGNDSYYIDDVLPNDSSNNSNPGSKKQEAVGQLLQLYIPILVGILGICGNGLVCFVFIYKKKHFDSLTNRLILNQSFLDLAASVFLLLQRFAPRPGQSAPALWLKIVCRIWGTEFFLWAIVQASTYNLL